MSVASNQLDAFSACAQTGNFTKAAELLHITQSALSQRILNLEQELETSLFIRDRKGVRLTPAGQELVRYCQAKQALEKEAIARIKGAKSEALSGQVRIGGFSSVMRSVILPALTPLLREHPELRLQFISKEMDELPKLLQNGEIDYLVLHYEWVRDELENLFLGEEVNVLVEKKNYLGPDVYLDHDENDQTTSRYFKLKRDKRRIERRYLDDVYGLIDGVKMGLGRAVLPVHLIRREPSIRIVDQKTTLKFPVVLHYYRQPYYTKLHEALVGTLRKNTAGLLLMSS